MAAVQLNQEFQEAVHGVQLWIFTACVKVTSARGAY